MPTVKYKNSEISVQKGDNLRKVLLNHKLTPHNAKSKMINCMGMGTCGTCAVEIEGKVSPMGKLEKTRLSFSPHKLADGLRLACQCQVLGNVKVKKYAGFWGQDVQQEME